jgi:hypothetical protein
MQSDEMSPASRFTRNGNPVQIPFAGLAACSFSDPWCVARR